MNLTTTTVTMSSLELVAFINTLRGEEEAELTHAHFLQKVPLVLNGGEANFRSSYLSTQNKELPCYQFPKREACLMAMSYSYELQAKVFDRMTELEKQGAPELNATVSLMGAVADALRMDNVSRLSLVARAVEVYAPHALQFLPSYSVTAPLGSKQLSSEVHHSATELLKTYPCGLSVRVFNDLAIKEGYLEVVTRQSKSRGTVPFKSVTAKGLAFGLNQVNAKNPNETQPHWYDSKFLDLVNSIQKKAA